MRQKLAIVAVTVFLCSICAFEAAAQKVRYVSEGDHETWKIGIQHNHAYHINLNKVHKQNVVCHARKGSPTSNIFYEFTKEGDEFRGNIAADEVFISCHVENVGRSHTVSAQRAGGGGSASFSFQAAAMSIGAM